MVGSAISYKELLLVAYSFMSWLAISPSEAYVAFSVVVVKSNEGYCGGKEVISLPAA